MENAIVEAFVTQDARVPAVDIKPDGLKPVVAQGHGLVHAFTCDYSDPVAVHAVVESISQELGRVSFIADNAAILSKPKVAETALMNGTGSGRST
jgi:NAD(P)-dependent dehydrogenase (short-subunit alcohol dehydrogenase family)